MCAFKHFIKVETSAETTAHEGRLSLQLIQAQASKFLCLILGESPVSCLLASSSRL